MKKPILLANFGGKSFLFDNSVSIGKNPVYWERMGDTRIEIFPEPQIERRRFYILDEGAAGDEGPLIERGIENLFSSLAVESTGVFGSFIWKIRGCSLELLDLNRQLQYDMVFPADITCDVTLHNPKDGSWRLCCYVVVRTGLVWRVSVDDRNQLHSMAAHLSIPDGWGVSVVAMSEELILVGYKDRTAATFSPSSFEMGELRFPPLDATEEEMSEFKFNVSRVDCKQVFRGVVEQQSLVGQLFRNFYSMVSSSVGGKWNFLISSSEESKKYIFSAVVSERYILVTTWDGMTKSVITSHISKFGEEKACIRGNHQPIIKIFKHGATSYLVGVYNPYSGSILALRMEDNGEHELRVIGDIDVTHFEADGEAGWSFVDFDFYVRDSPFIVTLWRSSVQDAGDSVANRQQLQLLTYLLDDEEEQDVSHTGYEYFFERKPPPDIPAEIPEDIDMELMYMSLLGNRYMFSFSSVHKTVLSASQYSPSFEQEFSENRLMAELQRLIACEIEQEITEHPSEHAQSVVGAVFSRYYRECVGNLFAERMPLALSFSPALGHVVVCEDAFSLLVPSPCANINFLCEVQNNTIDELSHHSSFEFFDLISCTKHLEGFLDDLHLVVFDDALSSRGDLEPVDAFQEICAFKTAAEPYVDMEAIDGAISAFEKNTKISERFGANPRLRELEAAILENEPLNDIGGFCEFATDFQRFIEEANSCIYIPTGLSVDILRRVVAHVGFMYIETIYSTLRSVTLLILFVSSDYKFPKWKRTAVELLSFYGEMLKRFSIIRWFFLRKVETPSASLGDDSYESNSRVGEPLAVLLSGRPGLEDSHDRIEIGEGIARIFELLSSERDALGQHLCEKLLLNSQHFNLVELVTRHLSSNSSNLIILHAFAEALAAIGEAHRAQDMFEAVFYGLRNYELGEDTPTDQAMKESLGEYLSKDFIEVGTVLSATSYLYNVSKRFSYAGRHDVALKLLENTLSSFDSLHPPKTDVPVDKGRIIVEAIDCAIHTENHEAAYMALSEFSVDDLNRRQHSLSVLVEKVVLRGHPRILADLPFSKEEMIDIEGFLLMEARKLIFMQILRQRNVNLANTYNPELYRPYEILYGSLLKSRKYDKAAKVMFEFGELLLYLFRKNTGERDLRGTAPLEVSQQILIIESCVVAFASASTAMKLGGFDVLPVDSSLIGVRGLEIADIQDWMETSEHIEEEGRKFIEHYLRNSIFSLDDLERRHIVMTCQLLLSKDVNHLVADFGNSGEEDAIQSTLMRNLLERHLFTEAITLCSITRADLKVVSEFIGFVCVTGYVEQPGHHIWRYLSSLLEMHDTSESGYSLIIATVGSLLSGLAYLSQRDEKYGFNAYRKPIFPFLDILWEKAPVELIRLFAEFNRLEEASECVLLSMLNIENQAEKEGHSVYISFSLIDDILMRIREALEESNEDCRMQGDLLFPTKERSEIMTLKEYLDVITRAVDRNFTVLDDNKQ